MKRSFLVISMMLIVGSMMGCATSRELERVQAQERLIDAKADQALQEAQAAKAAAESAKVQADTAAARADDAVKMAEERERIAAEKERIAEEKAARAEAAFQSSMKK